MKTYEQLRHLKILPEKMGKHTQCYHYCRKHTVFELTGAAYFMKERCPVDKEQKKIGTHTSENSKF